MSATPSENATVVSSRCFGSLASSSAPTSENGTKLSGLLADRAQSSHVAPVNVRANMARGGYPSRLHSFSTPSVRRSPVAMMSPSHQEFAVRTTPTMQRGAIATIAVSITIRRIRRDSAASSGPWLSIVTFNFLFSAA